MARIRSLALLALSLTAFAALAAPQTFNVPTPAKSVPVPASSVMDPAATVPVSVTVPSGCTATQTGSAIAVACSSGPTPPPAGCTAAFCLTSVKVSAATVAAGGSVTVSASVTASAAGANQTIDLEVDDPSGNKVAGCQNWQTGVAFTAQQPVSPTPLTCTIPATAKPGTYGVFVGTFAPAPANTLLWEAKPAATFTVTAGATPPPATGALTTPTELLNYLVSLPGQPRHLMVGQHTNIWDADPLDNWTPLSPKPAVMGVSFGVGGSPSDSLFVNAANQQLAAGGIVQVSIWPGSPTASPVQGGDSNGAVNFGNITVPGTIEYKNWQAFIGYLAQELEQIDGPVILRLFHEVNGTWFWWGNKPAAQFQALWNLTRSGLQAAGVTNALYEYNVNAGVGNYTAYYAGAATTDIVSEDSYPPGANDPAYAALASLGKPIILAETGANPTVSKVPPNSFDNSSIMATTKASYQNVVAVMYWCQVLGLTTQNGAAQVLSDAAGITLPQLPH